MIKFGKKVKNIKKDFDSKSVLSEKYIKKIK